MEQNESQLTGGEDRSRPIGNAVETVFIVVFAAFTIATVLILAFGEPEITTWLVVLGPLALGFVTFLNSDRRVFWTTIGLLAGLVFLTFVGIGFVLLWPLLALSAWWFARTNRLGQPYFLPQDLLWEVCALAGMVTVVLRVL